MEKRLIPYTVYLPAEYYAKIKKYAKARKASSTIRDALCSFLDGDDKYMAGYKKGISDAKRAIQNTEEATSISVYGVTISDAIVENLPK